MRRKGQTRNTVQVSPALSDAMITLEQAHRQAVQAPADKREAALESFNVAAEGNKAAFYEDISKREFGDKAPRVYDAFARLEAANDEYDEQLAKHQAQAPKDPGKGLGDKAQEWIGKAREWIGKAWESICKLMASIVKLAGNLFRAIRSALESLVGSVSKALKSNTEEEAEDKGAHTPSRVLLGIDSDKAAVPDENSFKLSASLSAADEPVFTKSFEANAKELRDRAESSRWL